MERDIRQEQGTDNFLDGITKARFSQIFQKEELVRFQRFLDSRAKVAGGFVISLPLESGRAWFHHKIVPDKSTPNSIAIDIDELKVYIQEGEANTKIPDELEGQPVWWLEAK